MSEIQLVHAYDPTLFLTSLALAAFGGYVALWLIERVKARGKSIQGDRWLAAASGAMGVGIWSMHFTGMIALQLPVPVGYEPGLTLLSMVIAVLASLMALAVVRRERVTTIQLVGASALMGAAIAGMHYTGMAAMRIPGEMYFLPGLVLASLAVAFVASGGALWLFLRHRDRSSDLRAPRWGKLAGGLVLGAAVSGLHYTGMAAARFRDLRTDVALPDGEFLLAESLYLWVGLGSLALLGLGLVAALVDRRLQAAYADELRESQLRYETLLTEISDMVSVLDADGTIRYQSPSAEKLFGFDSHERTGRSAFERIHPDDLEEVHEAFERSLVTSVPTTLQYRLRHADGSWRVVESTSVNPEVRELGAIVEVTRDITDRVEAQEKYRAVFHTTPSAVGLATLEQGRFLDVNRAFAELVGRSREEMIGRTAGELDVWARPADRERVVERVKEMGSVRSFETAFRDVEGDVVDVLFSARVLEFGGKRHLLGVATDISELKAFEKALERMALHDQLTGLPNRTLFHDRLTHALERGGREGKLTAVVFLDLDRFKVINDSLGHSAGDRVLQIVADRLTGVVRDADTVARVGGDEFAVLLEGLSSPDDIEHGMARICGAFEVPVEVEGTSYSLNASIGVAHSGIKFEEPGDLVRLADAAMYRVKRPGSTLFHVFEPSMDRDLTDRLQRETALRRAVEEEQFEVHYQPIFRLETREIVGAEALARWRHPKRGLLEPHAFISLAEEIGLIGPMGDQVLRGALRLMGTLRDDGLIAGSGFRMSINRSAQQQGGKGVVDYFEEACRDAGVPLSSLTLEITETAAMTAASEFQALRGSGLEISIDDFGTGYSSLDYLRHIPADELKIDRSFIAQLHAPDRTANLVQAILDVARRMELRVVAEGIETDEQLALLEQFGCPYGQGYLFAEPMPAAGLEELLASRAEDRLTTGPT